MHFVALLYDRNARSLRRTPSRISLRGYNSKTWVPAELSHIKLAVYAIAYAPCPTSRDTFLSNVQRVQVPFTWDRYKGKVIDFIYKHVHKTCEEYMRGCSVRTFDLHDELISMADRLIDEAKNEYSDDHDAVTDMPNQSEGSQFYDSLKKIIRFEAGLTATAIDFEIARNASASPRHIFSEHFDFNTDFPLNPQHQGFSSPATPDFIFRHKVIGDIKSGPWKQFFEYTAIAYALAYEDDIGQDMDYGVILNVELPTRRRVPVHYEVKIEHLDDRKRERFVALRNRKLEIINSKQDPGKPARDKCAPDCPFLSHCWETGD